MNGIELVYLSEARERELAANSDCCEFCGRSDGNGLELLGEFVGMLLEITDGSAQALTALGLRANGIGTKEIASQMNLSTRRVRKIFEKMEGAVPNLRKVLDSKSWKGGVKGAKIDCKRVEFAAAILSCNPLDSQDVK